MIHETQFSTPESWLGALERRLAIPESLVLVQAHRLALSEFQDVARWEATLAAADGLADTTTDEFAHRSSIPHDTVESSRMLLVEIGFAVVVEPVTGSGRPQRRLNQPSVLLDADYPSLPFTPGAAPASDDA